MIIHDAIFEWKGYGGKFRLAAGSCRLRILDLSRDREKGVAVLKPIIVVVSDLPNDGTYLKRVTVRSCCSHIATSIVSEFNIDRNRMVFVEYHTGSTYGKNNEHEVPERFDAVVFEWHGDKALHPKWSPVKPPLLDTLKSLIL